MKINFIYSRGVTILMTVLLSFAIAPNTYAMEINAGQIGKLKAYIINLTGNVVDGDFDKLIHTIKSKGYLPTAINISSRGGSVLEALKIAEFIRESLVPVNAVEYCYSSCFYIWIAAIERKAFNKKITEGNPSLNELLGAKIIGIHRPYFDKAQFANLSMSEAGQKYDELENHVRGYLRRMRVPEKWIDEMMRYSSENMRLVTREELISEFGFVSRAFQEWIIAKCPIDKKDLLLGKVGFERMIRGPSVTIKDLEDGEHILKYMAHSSCEEKAVKDSQKQIVKKLLQ